MITVEYSFPSPGQPNVLISAFGEACIADFGLSHAIEEVSLFSNSTSWKQAGNPAWMAPELLNEDSPPRSPLTDVFSFGRMMIEVKIIPSFTYHDLMLTAPFLNNWK